MKQGIIYEGSDPIAPRVTQDSIYPNISNAYTPFTYTGERLAVLNKTHDAGIASWFNFGTAQQQGLAIWDDIMVRVGNTEGGAKPCNVFRFNAQGSPVNIASTSLAGIGHGNALEFAPVLEDGQTLPYLYVAGMGDNCYVLSFDENYAPTIVQTITISTGNQMLMGDDGFIWSSAAGSGNHRRFRKYRRVAVAEGDVTLTDADKLDDWQTMDVFPSENYTMQGWKVKFGQIWMLYGTAGTGQERGIVVYDTATHRRVAQLVLTSLISGEPEDLDFRNNSIFIGMITGTGYSIRV